MHSGDHETKGKMPWNANLSSSSFIKYTKMSLNHYFWQKFHIKWKLTLWKPHNLSHTIIHLNPRCSLRHCLLFLTRCHSWFSSHLQHTFSKRQAEVFNRNKTKTRRSSINSWWFASCHARHEICSSLNELRRRVGFECANSWVTAPIVKHRGNFSDMFGGCKFGRFRALVWFWSVLLTRD